MSVIKLSYNIKNKKDTFEPCILEDLTNNDKKCEDLTNNNKKCDDSSTTANFEQTSLIVKTQENIILTSETINLSTLVNKSNIKGDMLNLNTGEIICKKEGSYIFYINFMFSAVGPLELYFYNIDSQVAYSSTILFKCKNDCNYHYISNMIYFYAPIDAKYEIRIIHKNSESVLISGLTISIYLIK